MRGACQGCGAEAWPGAGTEARPEAQTDVGDVERGIEASGEKLLVVDDDPFIARLLEIELAAAGYQVRVANDGQQALQLVEEDPPDLVITDVMMPHVDGFELTRLLRQDPRTAVVSVIILTARGLSADKLEGFAIGADDYIVKPFDTPELLARVRGVLRRSKEMKDESPLTGLPGNVRIQEEIEDRVSSGDDFALLYADLDQFKAFNDHYGFARGDQVIQEVAQMMESVVQELAPDDAFVGHLGGDDFVLVVPPSAAALVADTIVQRFDDRAPEYYDEADRERGWIEVLNRRGEQQRFPTLTISIGIASTQRRRFAHFAEVVAVATEMKNFTKSTPGSSWAIDRRTN
jgi:diguanylate cyclase (GGDEF)-like protein